MTQQRKYLRDGYERHHVAWGGIDVEICFERNWLGSPPSAYHPSHLEIRSVRPERAQLPITETGYLSHFMHGEAVDAAGGPVAFFLAWLDHAARSTAWQAQQAANRQLALF